ncbi:MAG: acyl-CoA thioesterase [Rhodospirillales bacterium]|nr:acyl-CoA thioesterase [Rhodospirillales bacterium]
MHADTPENRGNYPYFTSIQTRWADNDLYGHVNNVTYYSYFDTVVNNYLMEEGGFNPFSDPVIGVAVETLCRFKTSITHPEKIEAGLRVGALGNSSVRYEIGIFKGGMDEAAAAGHFVHVFVDRKTNTPVPVPAKIREALMRIQKDERAR